MQVRCLLMTLGTHASECVNNVTDVVQTTPCQVIRENSSQLKTKCTDSSLYLSFL